MDDKETKWRNDLREVPPGENKPQRTICEVHREIYDRLEDLGINMNDPVISMLEEAYASGKKMMAKLQQLGEKKDLDWYAAERARVIDDTLEKRRQRRFARQAARLSDKPTQ